MPIFPKVKVASERPHYGTPSLQYFLQAIDIKPAEPETGVLYLGKRI